MANTILRHDGSAKIGRMLVTQDGDMAWTENGGLFEINPTKAMPALDDLKGNAGLNEEGRGAAKLGHGLSASSQSGYYTVGNPKSNIKEDSSSAHAELLGFKIREVIGDERVEVVVTVTLRADLSAQKLKWDGYVDADAKAWFTGDLIAGGESRKVYLSLARDLNTEDEDSYSKQYTLRISAGTVCTLSGELSASVRAETREADAGSTSTPLGTASECSASAANVRVEASYVVYYEAVKGQQRFIIARDGFCVFHNANRYIYCNARNGEFKVMGLTDFSRV